MDRTFNLLMVGVGGQGIVLASDIIARAALRAGHDVKISEIHGMSQRGGSVFAHVRFGRKVHSPVIPEGGADLLAALEEMETLRWRETLHAGTRLVVCREHLLPANTTAYPEGVQGEIARGWPQAAFLDPKEMAAAAGGPKYVNTVLLGFLSVRLDFDAAAWTGAIRDEVPPSTLEANLAAFGAGAAMHREA